MKTLTALLLALLANQAAIQAVAQDIRGLEVCTAEKQMERRTSCLQANVEFLQQALAKHARDTGAKLAATDRELAAVKAEIVALKAGLARLEREMALLRAKADSGKK